MWINYSMEQLSKYLIFNLKKAEK